MPPASLPTPTSAALTTFRASARWKAPDARSLAAGIENPGCNTRRVLDAAGVDKLQLARRLGPTPPEEQSRFATNRGQRFETAIKADDYAALIALLRRAGLPVEAVRVLRLKERYPYSARRADEVLRSRADATRAAILDMARGDPTAPSLIDGGALQWDFGGALARLETDGIAWRLGGRIHVLEIKSFPIVDGRADPEKVGAAAWQSAVYVAAIADLLDEHGLDAGLVSSSVLLVCPRNTSLVPTITQLDVSRQTRSLRRLLAGRASVAELLARLGPGVTLDTSGMDAAAAQAHLASVLAGLGTNYLPSCLSACPLAYHCRAQARSSGAPGHLGVDVRASLAGVDSVPRALELADGARADPAEADAAAMLVRARRLVRDAERVAVRHAA